MERHGGTSITSPPLALESNEVPADPQDQPDNYLKNYPYLFVRDPDQSDYFCTLCDNYFVESELQAHLFEGHQAKEIEDSFVRVCSNEAHKGYFIQRTFLNVCVICWAKIPKATDTSLHREGCPAPSSPDPVDGFVKVETTPDISNLFETSSEEMNGCTMSNGNDSPYHHPNLVIDIPEENEGGGPGGGALNDHYPVKRGRKKTNPPHHILPPPQFASQCIQCSLCSMVIPTPGYVVHLRDYHRITCSLNDTACPMCMGIVPLLDLGIHLASAHGMLPQVAINSILLWVLTSSTLAMGDMTKANLANKFGGASSMHTNPAIELDLPKPMGMSLPPLIKQNSHGRDEPLAHGGDKAQIPTVLQSLLNNTDVQPRMMAVESLVSKFISVHLGPNGKESIQCQICAKWFAIPPVKHLRGHLLTFKDEKKRVASLINGTHVCIICYDAFDELAQAKAHLVRKHDRAGDMDLRKLQDIMTQPQATLAADMDPKEKPKKIELDNAGRVKSGKVRKQCELCGEWSNIKWFFKHMSETHQALFCRCCREYLPIHEHEEHKKWHAEPPYMGQKIRIEQGQPVVIDRKERASLTPIGSLAAWGGSSGGKVVKAVDMGPTKSVPKKRKAPTCAKGGAPISSNQLIGHVDYTGGSPPKMLNNNATKDTLMPKETCPVCGIQITYKNLARHIKLRHKIKYKFCHKCRRLVPNTTYEDHKQACERNEVGTDPNLVDVPSGEEDTKDDVIDPTEFLDTSTDLEHEDIAAEDSQMSDSKKNDDFRANTSKTKLESLLGKEFKHPRRRCAICGYTVSYSNFKRHLRNAHPTEYQDCENDPVEFKKVIATFSEEIPGEDGSFIGHIVDEDDEDDDEEEEMDDSLDGDNKESICPVCEEDVPAEDMDDHCLSKHKEAYECRGRCYRSVCWSPCQDVPMVENRAFVSAGKKGEMEYHMYYYHYYTTNSIRGLNLNPAKNIIIHNAAADKVNPSIPNASQVHL
eukprot:snap_masked-scaffold183_size276960-processed-gene-1.19 protein:Tk01763 transcript:snap_masked-scaffold183_size276960-processed-gene-1.19-mRNA-1 annotation:"hypothetical protein T265_04347"